MPPHFDKICFVNGILLVPTDGVVLTLGESTHHMQCFNSNKYRNQMIKSIISFFPLTCYKWKIHTLRLMSSKNSSMLIITQWKKKALAGNQYWQTFSFSGQNFLFSPGEAAWNLRLGLKDCFYQNLFSENLCIHTDFTKIEAVQYRL